MNISELKPGDILLSPPPPMPEGWIGQAIVAITKGEVSHTAVYCGTVNGAPTIAHSFVKGIAYSTMEEYFVVDKTPYCHVRRHAGPTDLRPVIEAAAGYVGERNPYPFGNLGVLGILLTSKKVSENILRSKAFYDFTVLVGLKMLKGLDLLRGATGRGPHMMTCSQFAVQCYEDAGSGYDITFNKLLLDYKTHRSPVGGTSLIEFVGRQAIPVRNRPDLTDFMPEPDSRQEEQIAAAFIDLMRESEGGLLPLPSKSINEQDLATSGTKLVKLMCEILTGARPDTAQQAADLLSRHKTYFVTPDDLLVNTGNLESVGQIQEGRCVF